MFKPLNIIGGTTFAILLAYSAAHAEQALPACFKPYNSRVDLLLHNAFHHHHGLPVPKNAKEIRITTNGKYFASVQHYTYNQQGQMIKFITKFDQQENDAGVTQSYSGPTLVNIRRDASGTSVHMQRDGRFGTYKPLVIDEKQSKARFNPGYGHKWQWSWNDKRCEITATYSDNEHTSVSVSTFNHLGQVTKRIWSHQAEGAGNPDNFTILRDPKTGHRVAYLFGTNYIPVEEKQNDRGHWVSLTDEYNTQQADEPATPLERTIEYYR